ncbi:uncharacterized protein EDB91DRAFT_1081080 [Suillus paluster]|uniref:uncharacterized protein n=1 Tax=Suillus paluster TaxID=48578 RepID=UPI001B85EA25|nr:uncharacterized protein EDB91DRAFT_1081080 [Suillus paluster]KAG1743705.1 hypothetical protein EDB91DRAFT_1081080 [Suillus paluster]
MSEASSYHRDYRSHPSPDTRYYVDPGEHSSSPVHRNRYDSHRRLQDVSWVSASQQPPSPIHDPYARWYPPPPVESVDFPTPLVPGQPLPVAHSSPMMRRTPSPAMRVTPSPIIGEYMTVEDEEEEVPEVHEDYREVDFDFSNAPQHRMGVQKGARRWVGGFVKGLRKFPGLRKSPHRPSPSSDFASSLGAQHENDPQFPTISSLNLRPLTPTAIAQTAELMDMPQPQLYPQPSPQHHAYPQSPQHHTYPQLYAHKPPPPAAPSPVYAPGADVVPQGLSTVDERSNELTATQESHPRPHSSTGHAHSSHTHTHSQSQSYSQSHSTVQPVVHNTSAHVSPLYPKPSTATVTDYVTVPPPWLSPPPATRIKRFLHTLDQLPWVENEQIVDAYFPGRSSRHRRHPDSPVDDGKPAASWYNKRHNSLPTEMGMGPSSASLLYGWPAQMQKGYSQPGMVYPQFPYAYTPGQPTFVYPTTFPPGAYVEAPRGAIYNGEYERTIAMACLSAQAWRFIATTSSKLSKIGVGWKKIHNEFDVGVRMRVTLSRRPSPPDLQSARVTIAAVRGGSTIAQKH